MRYIKLGAIVFTMLLASFAISNAQDMKDMKGMKMSSDNQAKTETIQGEVIDMACYMTKGEKGEAHAECATMCINNGLPVGILDGEGHVYLCMTASHKPANSLLVQYAAKQVKVTGKLYKKGGMDLLAVEKVVPVESDTKKN